MAARSPSGAQRQHGRALGRCPEAGKWRDRLAGGAQSFWAGHSARRGSAPKAGASSDARSRLTRFGGHLARGAGTPRNYTSAGRHLSRHPAPLQNQTQEAAGLTDDAEAQAPSEAGRAARGAGPEGVRTMGDLRGHGHHTGSQGARGRPAWPGPGRTCTACWLSPRLRPAPGPLCPAPNSTSSHDSTV